MKTGRRSCWFVASGSRRRARLPAMAVGQIGDAVGDVGKGVGHAGKSPPPAAAPLPRPPVQVPVPSLPVPPGPSPQQAPGRARSGRSLGRPRGRWWSPQREWRKRRHPAAGPFGLRGHARIERLGLRAPQRKGGRGSRLGEQGRSGSGRERRQARRAASPRRRLGRPPSAVRASAADQGDGASRAAESGTFTAGVAGDTRLPFTGGYLMLMLALGGAAALAGLALRIASRMRPAHGPGH
jgi:hypothetical protein